jgi:hypothetical protein
MRTGTYRWLFLTLFLLLLAAVPSVAQTSSNADLVLRGKVLSIRPVSGDPAHVKFNIDLSIEFRNERAYPVIFLTPHADPQAEIFQLQVVSLSLTKLHADDDLTRRDIWQLSMLTSIDTDPLYRQVTRRLDQPTPPPELTRILAPQETWTWETTMELRFDAKTETREGSVFPLSSILGWDVIGKIGTPLWMRLNYNVWSRNLLRADKHLRKRLQQRWKNVGYLHTQPSLETRAIEVRFNEVRLHSSP